jgi:putative copper export protein
VSLLNFLQSLSLALHLASFALWIGAIVFFLFVFAPAVHALGPSDAIPALESGRRSLQAISWSAASLLLFTGIVNFLFRAGASSHLTAAYYSVLGAKVLFFFAMVIHLAIQSFKYGPPLAALSAQIPGEVQSWPEPLLSKWKGWFTLAKINATLGLVVLVLGLALRWS